MVKMQKSAGKINKFTNRQKKKKKPTLLCIVSFLHHSWEMHFSTATVRKILPLDVNWFLFSYPSQFMCLILAMVAALGQITLDTVHS